MNHELASTLYAPSGALRQSHEAAGDTARRGKRPRRRRVAAGARHRRIPGVGALGAAPARALLPPARWNRPFPDGQPGALRHRQARRPQVRLHNWSPVHSALRSGDIGFAEPNVDGRLDHRTTRARAQVFIRNRDAGRVDDLRLVSGAACVRLKHWLNRNTKEQAKKNIHAHYEPRQRLLRRCGSTRR